MAITRFIVTFLRNYWYVQNENYAINLPIKCRYRCIINTLTATRMAAVRLNWLRHIAVDSYFTYTRATIITIDGALVVAGYDLYGVRVIIGGRVRKVGRIFQSRWILNVRRRTIIIKIIIIVVRLRRKWPFYFTTLSPVVPPSSTHRQTETLTRV